MVAIGRSRHSAGQIVSPGHHPPGAEGSMKASRARAAVPLDPAIEARPPAGMTGAAVAGDGDERQKGVLVAVDPHFDQGLGLARGVALAPQRPARARPVMDDSGGQRRLQSGLVHMRHHQHVAPRRIDRDAGGEAVGAEFRIERAALLPVACGVGDNALVWRSRSSPVSRPSLAPRSACAGPLLRPRFRLSRDLYRGR